MSRLLALIVMVPYFLLIAIGVHPAFGGNEQELIYALHLDDLVLSESITVFEREGELFLPVGELASLLNLAISYRGEGKAAGYIMDESRTFEVDAAAGTLILRGVKSKFDTRLAIIQKDDLFIAASALSKWLPVHITSDKAQQIITVEAREKLPLQQLLERKARFQNLKKASIDEDPSFPDITPPYSLLAPPVVDLTTSSVFSGKDFGHVLQKTSLLASGDLAALNASLNLSESNGAFDRADFTAGRVDSKAELLGPLHATSYALGAVQTPAFAGISLASSPMYGFLVSNRPTNLPTQFTTHDIVGPLPQGWDAELYYNGIPIAYQAANIQAIYSFTNLPLRIGLNEFRLVLHGPNGETRIEMQHFLLDGLMVQPGNVQYALGANRELVGGGRNANGILMADIGISRNLSGFIGTSSVADNLGHFISYADLGLKGTVGSSLLTLDHVRSYGNGSATLLTMKGYFSGYYVTVGQSLIDRFVSELFPLVYDPIVYNSSLKLEGSLPLSVRIPFGLESNLDLHKSGEAIPSFTGRLSGELAGLSISEQLAASIPPGSVTTIGTTQVGTSLNKVSLRGQVSYVLSPAASFSTIQLAATKDIGTTYQLTGQINHDPAVGSYDFTVGLAKRIGAFGLLISTGITTYGVYTLSMQLSVSAGRNSRTDGIITDAFQMSPYGAVTLLTYVDQNGNGVYDIGEPLLEGVRFVVNGGVSLGATGKDGILFIKQLPVGVPIDISVSQESIPEPFLVPAVAGYRIEPRPGVTSVINFNFVPSGEVDGMVQFSSKKELVPVADVKVTLLDRSGRVVAKTLSEQSGYFLFKNVKGGEYSVVLGENEAARLQVYQKNPVVLVMPAEGDMLTGNDLTLERVDPAKVK